MFEGEWAYCHDVGDHCHQWRALEPPMPIGDLGPSPLGMFILVEDVVDGPREVETLAEAVGATTTRSGW